MVSNQTNRLQSLDSSVEEFVDGDENENAKQKTNHDVALFHEFLVLKGEMRQIMDKLTPQKMNKEYERGIRAQFQILNFRRIISTYFQDVLFHSN